MAFDHLVEKGQGAVPLTIVREKEIERWARSQPENIRNWVSATGFAAKPGTFCLLPDPSGRLTRALVGMEAGLDRWSMAAMPSALPPRLYQLDADTAPSDCFGAAFGWAIGGYAFSRYRRDERRLSRLIWPGEVDAGEIRRQVGAMVMARDLINTPAEDMGPAELAAAARSLAKRFRAKFSVVVGDDLLRKNYPSIHAVGRASSRPPRLIDMRWGREGPMLVLVGKGVCFDSGGLDLKSSAAMRLMKKDMGGAALVLGLAQAIMSSNIGIRLRVLIPAVENSVSGNAYRPLDVIRTRKGQTIEIGDTDAEGRVILCDAIAEADSARPDLIIDAATLTGSARVALGADLPALFCNDDELADLLLKHGRLEADPLWRLPLHPGYRRMLDSRVADINTVSEGPHAGAITAALYLQEFVSPGTKWMHIDTLAWNMRDRPGRPEGGEALGLRALLSFVRNWARPKPSAVKVLPTKPPPRPSPRKTRAGRLRR
jgi:leucyl aminopeptidase